MRGFHDGRRRFPPRQMSRSDAWRGDMAALRGDLEARIAATERRLLKWVIGIGIAAVIAIVGALSGVIWAATQVLLHAHQ